MTVFRYVVCFVFTIFFLTPNSLNAAPATTETNLQSLLTKMALAPTKVNYRGVFTYQNHPILEPHSISVEHWVDKGVAQDRLVFMNGPEREILRAGQSTDCVSMGEKLLDGSFFNVGVNVGSALAKLTDVYQFEVRAGQRVAGRSTRVLQVIPMDAFRYGYILSLDEETGLILKSWLIDEEGRPLERYQFVSIEYGAPVVEFQKTKNLPHQHKASAMVTPCNPNKLNAPTHWKINWIPSGFSFAGEKKLSERHTVLMYTDGLSTFSIFIEPSEKAIPQGVGHRGATLAYLSRLDVKDTHFRVSIVGEIPVAAAAKIAQAVSIIDASNLQ